MIPNCVPSKTQKSLEISIDYTTFTLSTDNNSLKYINFYGYDYSDIRYFGVQIYDGETGQLVYDDTPFAPSYNSGNLLVDYTSLFNENVCSFLTGKSGVQLDSWIDNIFYPFVVNNTLFLAVKVFLGGQYQQDTATIYLYTVRTVIFKFENGSFTIVLDVDEPALYLGLSDDLCVSKDINFWSKYIDDQNVFRLIDNKYLISLTEWNYSAPNDLNKGVLITIYDYVLNPNHPRTPIAFAFVFIVDKENSIVNNKLNAELKEVIAISEYGDFYSAKSILIHEDKIFFNSESAPAM
ncbi:hypothetical protein PGDDIFCJ_00088 [Thermus phage YS40_Isch]|nr:hypothetical protein PGDDIFCJ_00088 [Thermus phage YS40_Isch]